MKYSVQLGFGIIILLMIASSGGVLYQTQHANSIVDELVSVTSTKIEYAYIMRSAIFQRANSLHIMLTIDDAFELDEEIFNFHALARPYREARSQLLALPMTERERLLHDRLRALAMASQPLSEHSAELMQVEAKHEDIVKALNIAREQRAPMFVALDELVSLQKQYGHDALTKSRALYDETRWAIVIITALVLALSFSISIYVSHIVARKNRQLLDKNQELEIASDKAKAATDSKSAFLANMSHEIRTPITAIIGFAESSLFGGQTMEMRQKALKIIIGSGKHLLHIINDILDLSKIEANKLEVEKIPTSIFRVMKDVEDIVKPLAAAKGLDFNIRYSFPLPEKINTDPLRVKQIVLNLCSNAVKFTETGHVYIDILYRNKDNKLIVEVADSGIGIDEKKVKYVFEPFSQAEASTSRRYGGTGLGLSLSNDLARTLGGLIEVDSTSGAGSCFRLLLDAGKLDSLDFIDTYLPVDADQPALSPLATVALSGKVLVVEDNDVNQKLLTLFLEKLNVEIVIAENGQVALDKTKEEEFDLILMDIQMPIMDGVEATRILRQRNYTKPIVALTANVMKEDVEKYIEVGCNGSLSKPIDTKIFFEVVSSYLISGGDANDAAINMGGEVRNA